MLKKNPSKKRPKTSERIYAQIYSVQLPRQLMQNNSQLCLPMDHVFLETHGDRLSNVFQLNAVSGSENRGRSNEL